MSKAKPWNMSRSACPKGRSARSQPSTDALRWTFLVIRWNSSTFPISRPPSGRELGSVAQAKKPFLVKDILLTVRSNHIPGCVASINIYRIEGKKESFLNVLQKPIYFEVAVSNDPQNFDIRPEETLLLEPGKYFIAFQIVGCNSEALQAFLAKTQEEQEFWEMSMDFNIYLKSSYVREVALGEMKSLPVNIGVAVKGLEYQ